MQKTFTGLSKIFVRLIVMFVGLIFQGGCTQAEDVNLDESARTPEVFLIPDGYRGAFYVIFNQNAELKHNNLTNTRRYDVPANGVVMVNLPSNEGWVEQESIAFYYNNQDQLTEITERVYQGVADTPENRADNTVKIFGGSIGHLESIHADCIILNQQFYVGTNADLLDGNNQFDLADHLEKIKIDCTGMEPSRLRQDWLESQKKLR